MTVHEILTQARESAARDRQAAAKCRCGAHGEGQRRRNLLRLARRAERVASAICRTRQAMKIANFGAPGRMVSFVLPGEVAAREIVARFRAAYPRLRWVMSDYVIAAPPPDPARM